MTGRTLPYVFMAQGHRAAGIFAAVLFSFISPAFSNAAQDQAPGWSDRWHEVVAVVRDLERVGSFFTSVAGYEEKYCGRARETELGTLGFAEGTQSRFCIFAEPGAKRGFIRVIEAQTKEPQREARSSATLFDTGGIAGVNVRVDNVDAAFAKMQAAGWRAYADPVRFSVDDFDVAEAIFQGPDGLVIGLIERSKPALGPEWDLADGRLSRPNNAFIVVKDIAAEQDFLAQTFQWKPFLVDQGPAAKAGPNLYGIPHNLIAGIDRHVVWMHGSDAPQKTGSEGSAALMQFANAQGRDFSNDATAPNYGFVALRMHVDSAAQSTMVVKPTVQKTWLSPAGVMWQAITAEKHADNTDRKTSAR